MGLLVLQSIDPNNVNPRQSRNIQFSSFLKYSTVLVVSSKQRNVQKYEPHSQTSWIISPLFICLNRLLDAFTVISCYTQSFIVEVYFSKIY